LDLVLKGNKTEANILIGLGGEFAKYSAALTAKMKQWQASL